MGVKFTVMSALALFAVAAQAATIFPTSATGSSSYPGYNDFYAIDQGAGSTTTDWASFGQGNASKLNLDLGAVHGLATVSVTDRVTSGGGNGGYVGGTTDFTTSYSLQAFTDATFTTAIGTALVFTKSTPVGPTGIASFLDIENVSGLTGRYIQYSVIAANGPNPGLSNIAFGAVPEPATWGMMVVGFGMIGYATRRRRWADATA